MRRLISDISDGSDAIDSKNDRRDNISALNGAPRIVAKVQTTRLSQLLQWLRVEAGLTVYGLAKRSGLNRSTVLRCVSGRISQPRIDILNALARALDVEPELLYDAAWQDSAQPLPSTRLYLRSKYHLSDDDARAVAESLEALSRSDNNPPNAATKGGHHDKSA